MCTTLQEFRWEHKQGIIMSRFLQAIHKNVILQNSIWDCNVVESKIDLSAVHASKVTTFPLSNLQRNSPVSCGEIGFVMIPSFFSPLLRARVTSFRGFDTMALMIPKIF